MLLKIALLIGGIACAFGTVIPDGMMSLLEERIVGGYEADIEKFPWQVSIQYRSDHFCGGSIYDESTIITAAHCMEGEVDSNLKVRAGSRLWPSGGTFIGVKDFKIHPNYSDSTFYADVAIIRLETPLTFGDKIQPIPLPESLAPHGSDVKVSGWGTQRSGGNIRNELWAANIKLISRAECRSSDYDYGNTILVGMICAAGTSKDSCQGDSGGPLVFKSTLVGIVSWGYGYAVLNYPGVYTSTSYFKSWIVKTANQLA